MTSSWRRSGERAWNNWWGKGTPFSSSLQKSSIIDLVYQWNRTKWCGLRLRPKTYTNTRQLCGIWLILRNYLCYVVFSSLHSSSPCGIYFFSFPFSAVSNHRGACLGLLISTKSNKDALMSRGPKSIHNGFWSWFFYI